MKPMLALIVLVSALLTGGASSRAADELVVRAIIPAIAADTHDPAHLAVRLARERWRATGITDHETTTRIIVFGPLQVRTVELRNGIATITGARCSFGTQAITCPEVDPKDYTVDGLFAMIERRLADNPAPGPSQDFPPGFPYLVAEYDPERGHPTRISYGLSLVADSDVTIIVEAVRALPE